MRTRPACPRARPGPAPGVAARLSPGTGLASAPPSRSHLSLRTGAPRPPPAPARLSLRTGATLALLLCACPRPPASAPPTTRPAPAASAPALDPCAAAAIPGDTAAALARVDVLRRCGDGAGALAIFAALLRRDPRTRWGYEAAALAIAEGAPERARAVLRDGAAARVGFALLHVAAFEAAGQSADAEAARTHFQAALALVPDDPYALSVALRHYLALADREPERLALAVQLCHERVPAGPAGDGAAARDVRGDALLLATCARVALAADEPGEARRRFALALTLDPADAGARLAWAAAELAAGNDRSAAELYAAATDAPAASDRYLAGLGLGVARGRLHDHAGAERAYRAAAEARGVRPGSPADRLPPELQFNLGTLLAAATDPVRRAEARALLQAYAARSDADELRRLRARQLLLELRE